MTDGTTNMIMPVAPSGGFGGFGGGGDSWGWIILLLLIAGGGFGFGGGFDGAGAIYPWMNQADITTNGFQNAALGQGISGIQSSVTSGFGDVQNALCGGFAGVNATVNGAQNAISAQLYNNQLAGLERSFAAQTANTQGLTNLSSQLAQCCCDNRLATANLTSTVLAENCADRAVLADGIRDIITNATSNTQRILDQMCQDKIDAKNEKIADLERELAMAQFSASQVYQTQQIIDRLPAAA
jgi:hypothetical protein